MSEPDPELAPHEPSEITYAELYYPARPRSLRPSKPRGRLRKEPPRETERAGDADGSNPRYVDWLIQQSMLHDAEQISGQFSGVGSMWQNPFANPDPRAAIDTASVWFTAYPISLMTRQDRSFLATMGDPELWKAFKHIGIQAVHTGPVKRAGGIRGWDTTPSVDGHFDRISTHIDGTFGTEDEFRKMCEVANAHGGTIIDDIVPGHTGKGSDFRLAEMNVADYPGIYHMVEIPRQDWNLLPEVPASRDSVNIDLETEDRLEKAGYIIGRLQRVIFHDPGIKDTNWSVTRQVVGADGAARRWVYLHYFKEGQPSINWLDPTFAGMRMVIGDALHSLTDLGTGALRFDANGFLGVEKSAEGDPAWSEGHPLAEAANHLIASMVRKLGGFSFQELNLSIDDIKATSESGADLSYDFVNRPAYHHALATADTEFLRLTLNSSRDYGVQAVSLVHALQNHDELTYELVHFATVHRDDPFTFRGREITGEQLATTIRSDLTQALTGQNAPYNLVFTTNGIACTTTSVVAAALGYRQVDRLNKRDVERIKSAHLLLAMFNAWQPGVFALSGWDLCGVLTVERSKIANLLSTGDTRWINRGAYDLMGYTKDDRSSSGMPRGISLYGTLPAQVRDSRSFVSRLRGVLEVRSRFSLASSQQIDVPPVSHKGMLVMVHQLAEPDQLQATVLNFSQETVTGTVRSELFAPGWAVEDMVNAQRLGDVDGLKSFSVTLEPHEGRSLLIRRPDKA